MTAFSLPPSSFPIGGMPVPPMAFLDGPHGPAPDASEGGAADRLSLGQFRHLVANALQKILHEVGQQHELRSTPEGRRLCEGIERRILLSVALGDGLFGLTREPGPFPARLRRLGEAVTGLLGDPDQVLSLDVEVEGRCPAVLEEVVLRAAHELLGNAVKHGMYMRLVGRIRVALASGPRGTRLVVADDGWGGCRGGAGGPGQGRCGGQGLGLVRTLIAPFGGTLDTLSGRDGGFAAEVGLPPVTPADNRKEDAAASRPTRKAA